MHRKSVAHRADTSPAGQREGVRSSQDFGSIVQKYFIGRARIEGRAVEGRSGFQKHAGNFAASQFLKDTSQVGTAVPVCSSRTNTDSTALQLSPLLPVGASATENEQVVIDPLHNASLQ